MAGENWTFWLNMTNFALGLVTVLALLVVFAAVGWDFVMRRVHGTHAEETDLNSIDADVRAMLYGGSHSLSVPGLGLTMADGGEKVEPSDTEASDAKPRN